MAQKLNMPPVRMPYFPGQYQKLRSSPDRPSRPKATDMIIITVLLALTQFAAIIQLDSNKPEIIGNFRLMLTEPVRFNNRSEIQPPKGCQSRRQGRAGGEEADVQPWKMALVGEVAGKPRQEKTSVVLPANDPAGAEDLATAQQASGVTPVKWNVLDFIVNAVCADILQLRLISRARFMRFMIKRHHTKVNKIPNPPVRKKAFSSHDVRELKITAAKAASPIYSPTVYVAVARARSC